MKQLLRKSIRGLAAILLGQGFVLAIAITIQSCKKSPVEDEREWQKIEVAKLNSIIQERKTRFATINSIRKIQADQIGIMSTDASIINPGSDPNFVITPEYELQCETEVKPVYNQSRTVIAAYGITEQDLIDEWGANYDPELVVELALSIAAYEALDHEYGLASIRQALFLITPSYANRLYDCVKTALGIEALFELWRERALSTYAGKKMLIKAIGKVATRSLGWVGAAWAVADFVDCYW